MGKSTISVLVLLFLHSFQYSGVHSLAATPSKDRDFGYLKFAQDANELPSQGEYDYIVVGGGTAGCPLAATLSSTYKVLVLERGGLPTAFPSLATEGGFVSVLQEEDDGKTTPVERFVSEEGVASVKGRVLGGTSGINAGVYTRAKKDFYEETGIAWDMDLVNKAYEWVEDAIVYKPVDFPEWQTAQQQGFLEIGVHPDNGFNLAQIKGTRSNALTFDNKGNRHAADELLNKGNPNNLKIAVHAIVEKIIFSSSESSVTATGIIFSDSNGNTHKAFVRGQGEVILSAGAIGTPQLLLLSGVGPESYLSSLKIPVVRPHPYVAEFFAENPRNYINILPPTEVEPSNVRYLAISDNFYQCSISGPPFTTVPYSLFPSTTSNSSFIHIANKIPGPLSLASFKLGSSSDVRVHPKIRFNYFEDPKDLSNCVSGLKKLGELLRTDALKPFKANKDLHGVEGFNFLGLPLPSDQTDDAGFERHCKDQVASYWHFHGGCLVGKVVDTDLRVLGIDRLRVVDGSAFPVTPASHPAGTLLMFGRYMGLKILQERSEGSQFKSQQPEHSEL